ncbi:MAG: S8 family peptidase, partial [Bacteroidota bacterium]
TCHNTGQTFNDGHSGTNDADIDAPEAWEICTGSNNIVIAVLDQGVTSNHPDLPNTRQVRLSGSDFTGNDDNPSPVGNENHGNACAGVIAATMNNNEGIAGIAPNCKIMPIRMTGVVPSIVADAIEFAVDNGADILTNSWGYNSSDPNLHPVIVAAIQYAINNNCVVIFAAGNSARRSYDYNGYVSFPSNVNIPGVITVGASDRDDHQSDYSPSSDPESVNNQIIDIVAPSHRAYPPEAYLPPLLGGIPGETFEMWSIDIPGNTGYNPWPTGIFSPPSIGEQLPNSGTNYLDYTGRFGGTSHSCPVVAGVAALVLSINPNLTNLEVYDILTSTTDEVGGYTYENGWSEELGHGRVNAYSAVCETYNRSMYISGPPEICESGATFTIHNRPPGSTVVWRKSKPLIYVSGQGTDNYTVSAYSNDDRYNGTIISTITTSWGQVVCEKKSWVGRPGLPVTTPDGDPPIEVLYGSSFLVRIWDPPGADPSTGSWLSNGSISIRPGWGTGRDCIFDATGYDYGQWNVNTTNACGISDTYTGSVIVPGGGWDFTMFPNPANSYVEIHAEKNERYVEGTTSDTYEAVLYNSLMSLVYKSIETDKPILNINTSSFINGTYFLYITAGKQVEVFQLVVKH